MPTLASAMRRTEASRSVRVALSGDASTLPNSTSMADMPWPISSCNSRERLRRSSSCAVTRRLESF
jgi:hypothetical protein